jgi:hypothetical protein
MDSLPQAVAISRLALPDESDLLQPIRKFRFDLAVFRQFIKILGC